MANDVSLDIAKLQQLQATIKAAREKWQPKREAFEKAMDQLITANVEDITMFMEFEGRGTLKCKSGEFTIKIQKG